LLDRASETAKEKFEETEEKRFEEQLIKQEGMSHIMDVFGESVPNSDEDMEVKDEDDRIERVDVSTLSLAQPESGSSILRAAEEMGLLG